MINPQTFLFFGPSGSGKGTQARLLIEKLKEKDPQRKTLYVETGEEFRNFINTDNSFTALKTKQVVESGGLMPEFLPIWIWTRFLIKNFSGEEHLLLDGLSRRLPEAAVLDSAIKFYDRKEPTVFSIEISDEESTKRMIKRGRKDDTHEKIKERLDWYKNNVVPAINYFKENPYYKFISINGEQSIEAVHQEILQKLGL